MTETTKTTVILTKGTDITPEPVTWLWGGWLAKAKFHVLAGDPGLGKTSIALSLAATVTSGGDWPDGSICEPGNILVWSGEDDPADTLLPRLMAAGCDRDRCYFVSGARRDGTDAYFDPRRDMPALREAAEKIGNISLLILDPVVSTVKGDGNGNVEVRRDLQPVVDFARDTGSAVIGITHLTKGNPEGDPMLRIAGSIAFVAVARVVMIAAKFDHDDSSDRILVRCKSSCGPDGTGFTYAISQAEPVPKVFTNYIAWGDQREGTARELLGVDSNRETDSKFGESALEAAKSFLKRVLAEGPVLAKLVEAYALKEGISVATLRRAAKSVIKRKTADGSVWSLKPPETQDAQVKPDQTDEHLAHVEQVERPEVIDDDEF